MRPFFKGIAIVLLFLVTQSMAYSLRTDIKKSTAQTLTNFKLHDGDLVFQTSRSRQSKIIQQITHSIYTHMGMILLKQGQPFVLEAVQPVKFTPFLAWVARGEKGHVVVKRLRLADQVLTKEVIEKMSSLSESFMGLDYDLLFQMSDKRMYCSELIYKIYDRGAAIKIGRLQEFRTLVTHGPVLQQLQRRYTKAMAYFDPHEPVISPQSMFEEPKLTTIFESDRSL